MTTRVTVLIAAACFAVTVGEAAADSATCSDQKQTGAGRAQTRLLERTDGAAQRPVDVLAAPAVFAGWMSKLGQSRVAVSVRIGR